MLSTPILKHSCRRSPCRIPAEKKTAQILEGDVPSPLKPPQGCHFHTRCPQAMDKCKSQVPILKSYSSNENEHLVSCHLLEDK
ncbi:hypothetical protein PQO01_10760 [Lentisphaera marina]|nr:oligopeptide/dipeptide ABC transporter ATP-binding protein [Lentisphaera marina]MDD7985430.1 hypothetical protein [Lentisphaera marina]